MDSDAESDVSDVSTETVYIDCPHCNGEGQIATGERRAIPVPSGNKKHGITAPGPVHPSMLRFLRLAPRTEVSRVTWLKEVNAYVKANNLSVKNAEGKSVIRVDKKLAALECDCNEGDEHNMFSLVKLHSCLFYKPEAAAAMKIQTLYRGKVAREEVELKRLRPDDLLNPEYKKLRTKIAGVQSTVSKMKA
jgi:hypothetical protein